MNTVISSLDSPARASSWAVTPAAMRWVISPLMITVRARNSRSAMRLYGGATDGASGRRASGGGRGGGRKRGEAAAGSGPRELAVQRADDLIAEQQMRRRQVLCTCLSM